MGLFRKQTEALSRPSLFANQKRKENNDGQRSALSFCRNRMQSSISLTWHTHYCIPIHNLKKQSNRPDMSFQQVSSKALSRVRLSAQKNACIRQLPRRWATTRTTKSLAKKPNGPPKKRHNATNFTTATLNFQHSAILESPRNNVAKPTVESLKTLFVASAIPMVGFGFSKSVLQRLFTLPFKPFSIFY